MKLIYLKSVLKCDTFDLTIGTKFHFLEFGYYLAGSLLTTVRYHELFERIEFLFVRTEVEYPAP